MTEPILRLEGLHKRFGHVTAAADFSLDVQPGEFFTFLGPSGSGKSSILRMIAGLEAPDAGRILIAGRDMTGVPPWRRNLGMVFQHYAIFPHMNVAANVGYGLRLRKLDPEAIRAKVGALLKLVGLAGMEERSVIRLSGGEQQRVALARALALEPSLLLLDEPLSALDEKIRREMQNELKRIQHTTRTAFVYVTHDQEEALTMADRIAVIDRGRCVQCDAPERLFRRPRTRFVASFFRGCNVLETDCLDISGDAARLQLAGQEVVVAARGVTIAGRGRVAVAIRAEHPRFGGAPLGDGVALAAQVVDVIYRGTVVDHVLRLADGQTLVVTATQRQAVTEGGQVEVAVRAEDVILLAD
ncbi:MAG: ABC transporter ATP-binding protein [Gammaproteobacteria bacterium]